MAKKATVSKSPAKAKAAGKKKAGAKGHKLVIVESPAKARTISRMLGRSYEVKASVGHVRDLPGKWLGVDVKKGFIPKYEVPKAKAAVVNDIKAAAKNASDIYLATDPDREGEAISWHLVQAAKLGSMSLKRVVFHEITDEAVAEAFRHPRAIDMDLVEAQQARRILDRLVGYKISPLLCQSIRRGLSAGRVQSVALRMIALRERDIEGFAPREYWSIDADLEKTDKRASFTAALVGLTTGKKKIDIGSEGQAAKLVAELKKAGYAVSKVEKKETARQPAPPFTTSTLQQESWRKLRLSAERTMAVAQQLYEGLSIGSEGSVGLITYMRTDSVRVAPSALEETRNYIEEKYGAEFLPSRPRVFSKKAKGAQEAHEAIRPTAVKREPQAIQGYLNRDQFRLYELIWKRMVSSQMSPLQLDTTTVDIKAQNGKSYLFRAARSATKFAGFTVLYSEGRDDAEEDGEKAPLPQLTEGESLKLLDIRPEQHFTQPPKRYTQATLVKALEEKGIGRPSTYAPTITTIRERGYVEQDSGRFYPTELGYLVNDMLDAHFPNIVDFGFTAQMEEGLDQIARGEQEWVSFLDDFYRPFEQTLQEAREQMVKVPDEPTDEVCPNCGKPMVIKTGRYGKFIACTGYPQCKTTKPVEEVEKSDEPTGEVCPQCGKPMVIKTGRYGKFIACTGYPQCKATKPVEEVKESDEPTDEVCPKCGKPMVVKTGRYGKFIACSNYPRCKTTRRVKEAKESDEPTDEVCPKCGKPMVMKAGRYGKFIACSNYPRCKTTRRVKEAKTPDEPTDEVCPKCGKPMVVKTGRYGKFIACSRYPKCKTSRPVATKVGVNCPRCGKDLVELKNRKGRTFYGCSGYPECDFTANDRPVPQPCPECGGLLVIKGDKQVKCTKCKFSGGLDQLEKEAVKA
jgi:DNA topoisomerase-1